MSHIGTPTIPLSLPHLHLIPSLPIWYQIKKPYTPHRLPPPNQEILVRFDLAMAKALGSSEAASAAMATVVAPIAKVEGHGDAEAQSAEVEAVAPVKGAKQEMVAEAEGSGEDASTAMATVVAPIAVVEGQED
jgi:hypothetical protein